MAMYYMEIDTYWQGSKSYFVGPFDSREAAEAWVSQPVNHPNPNVWLSSSMCGGDIRDAWRVYINARSKTEAKCRGMREHYNVLPASTLPIASVISSAVRVARCEY